MTRITLCSKCNFLPTWHKCVECNAIYVCPKCSDKRSYSDLSKITCKLCGTAPVLVSHVEFAADSNDQQMLPLPRPQENVAHDTATVLEGNNADKDSEDGGAEFVTDVGNEGADGGPQKLTVRPDKFHKLLGKIWRCLCR